MSQRNGIDDLIAAVLDGTSVDWETLESGAPNRHRPTIRGLRVLEGIAAACRSEEARAAPKILASNAGSQDTQTGLPGTGGDAKDDQPLHLLEKVEEGTFGEVHRAWDVRLEREVAVKFLREDADDTDRQAVIEEARLLARVRHPNVVTVYGAGVIRGRMAFWTEFVNGRTLETIVSEEGPLSARATALVGVDLCRALTAVHQAGLLHGDINAKNAMREDGSGRVLLMDFGMGRHVRPGQAETGARGGTPLYLAPELLDGAPPTPRSDIYSLGVLLYRLLTGSYPVPGRTLEEIRAAHREGRRTPLADARHALPPRLVAVIERAISVPPHQRPPNAAVLEEALLEVVPAKHSVREPAARGGSLYALGRAAAAIRQHAAIIAALFLLLLSAGGAAWYFLHGTGQPPPSAVFRARDTVMIGTFENRTGFARLDGAVESALERSLGLSSFVSVASAGRVQDTLSLMKLPPETPLTRAVGLEVCRRDGGIRALLTGYIERLGSRFVISVSVVDPKRPQEPVVHASLEAAGEQAIVSTVQALSGLVRQRLGESTETVQDTEHQLEKVATPSLEALRLYSQAIRAAGRESWEESVALAREAARIDPGFASAHAWVAFGLIRMGRADEAAAPAALASSLAGSASLREQMFIRGLDHRVHGRPREAVAEYEALLGLFPDDTWAAESMRVLLQDNPEAIVRYATLAADLRPNNFRANFSAGEILLDWVGEIEKARTYLARARELSPPDQHALNDWLRFELLFETWLRGDVAAVVRQLEDDGRSMESRPSWLEHLGGLNLALGRLAAAEQAFHRMPEPYDSIQIALARGDRDGLKKWAESTLRGGSWNQLARTATLARITPVNRVERFVNQAARGRTGPVVSWAEGEVALARGNPGEAVQLLGDAWNSLRWSAGPYLNCGRSYAEALEHLGDFAKAASVLEESARNRVRLFGAPNGRIFFEWTRTQLQLVRLYRHMGRAAAADRLAAELSKLHAYADADFVVLRELQAR